jgi:hypothetical protein
MILGCTEEEVFVVGLTRIVIAATEEIKEYN